MPVRLKLYGERHTNTNYLSKLIELNLTCELIEGVVPTYVRTLENLFSKLHLRDAWFRKHQAENLGWKHGLVNGDLTLPGVKFITLTKNPYSWLLSMYRRPYHQHYKREPTLEEFLTLPWQTVGRENVSGVIANPIQLWNLKNRSYLNLPDECSLHLNTESTFIDAAAVIAEIATNFAIENRQQTFIDFDRSTKKRTDRDGDYYRDYYLNERWRSAFSDQAIAIINKELDQELVESYGYNLL